MLARHGYGVLALDLPGNGESEGHSNGLGDNAQPAVDAGARLALAPRRTSTRTGSRGFGLSLGAEVLIEAAAGEPRLRAVVADGATRPQDAQDVHRSGARRSGRVGVARDPGRPRRLRHAHVDLAEPADRADRAAARAARGAPAASSRRSPPTAIYRGARRADRRSSRAARRRPHRRPAQARPEAYERAHDRVPRPRARPLTPWGRARGHLPADGGRRGSLHRCDAPQPAAARALGGRSDHARGVRRLPRQGGGAAARVLPRAAARGRRHRRLHQPRRDHPRLAGPGLHGLRRRRRPRGPRADERGDAARAAGGVRAAAAAPGRGEHPARQPCPRSRSRAATASGSRASRRAT